MIQRFNTYKKVTENTTNPNQYIEKLTSTDIDLIYDGDLYDDIESIEATISYEIEIVYRTFGIDSLNPHHCSVVLYVTFNKDDESIEKIYNFTNVECDTSNARLPFHPDSLDVNLKENKIIINF